MRVNVDETVQVAQGVVLLARIPIKGRMSRLLASIDVANVAAVDQFQVRGKVGDDEITFVSAGAGFTTPIYPVLNASGDLTAQAANTTGWLVLDVTGLREVSLWAACALDGPTAIRTRATSDESETAG